MAPLKSPREVLDLLLQLSWEVQMLVMDLDQGASEPVENLGG